MLGRLLDAQPLYCSNGLFWGSDRISKMQRETPLVKLYHTVRHEYNTEHTYIN